MKRFLVIAVFLLTTAGVCMADYDYYTKRDPQTCYDVLSWEIEIMKEMQVLSSELAEIIKQQLKPGDNESNFHKKQELENKKSIINDEYRAMKEVKDRLCEKK